MSLHQLEQTLAGAIQPNGSLSLTGDLLGAPALGDLIARLYPDTKTMTVAGAAVTLSSDGTQLMVSGTTTIGSIAGAATTVMLTEPGGTLQMQATVTLPAGTTLGTLFPALLDTTLIVVALTSGALILSSLPDADAGTGRTLDPGLSLTGVIDPVALLPYLAAVLPSGTQMALAGPIGDFALPLFDLTTVSVDAKLAGVPLPALSFEFQSVNIQNQPGDPIALGHAILIAGMTISGVTGTVRASLPSGGSLLTMDVGFVGLTLTSFEEVATFIGSVDPFDALPAPVKSEIDKVTDAFALTSLQLQIDMDMDKIAFPAVSLGVTVDLKGFEIFSLIPDLAVTELDLRLTVNNASNPVAVTYGAAATIEIDGSYHVILSFQSMSTGGYQLSVAQATDSVLHLTDVLKTFVPGLTGFPEFDVERFGLTILPDTNQYNFDAVIKSDWEIISTPSITLTEIDVAALYDPQLTPTTSGGIVGIFDMKVDSDPDNDIVITLSAVKPQGAEGWVLSGQTGPDQIIPVGNLFSAIANTFNSHPPVPGFLAGLGIENLDLQLNTADNSFHYGTQIIMPFSEDVVVTLTVLFDVEPLPSGTGYDTTLRGTIQVAQYRFDIVFDDKTAQSDTLIATFQPAGDGRDAVTLKELLAGISPEVAADVPIDIEIDLKDVKFVFYRDSQNRMAFGLDVGIPIYLSNIPFVGNKLPDDFTLAVTDLQGVYATAAFDKTVTGDINALLPDGVVPFPKDGLGAGVNITADVQVGGWTQHFQLAGTAPPSGNTPSPTPTPTPGASQGLVTPPAPTPAPAAKMGDDSYKWINVYKQIGIFQFDRIGAGYVDNRLTLALDAGVSLGPLTFSMIGLSVGSPLDKFSPVFLLNGLGLTFSKPPITIAGGFLKVKETQGTSYYGEVTVKVANIGFSALGGWSPDADPASFFIYANVEIPLGGPPYLQLKAIAGGIGINRSLILPTIDDLAGYILLPKNAPPAAATPVSTIQSVLPKLQKYFVDQPGEYWVAAGIEFSSFEMIEAFALVTVSFGVDFQLGVLGSVAATFPTEGTTPIAYIEADLIASFAPSSGLLSFEGVLSPQSYVLGGFVKVQGGFALCLWFSGDNAGDFVVSVGGYYPSFKRPDHYPNVPRIKIGYALGPVSVSGSAYFALTPAMLMAGFQMNAVFDAGPIRAWFDAGIDLLIAWSPFHYEADSYVSLGVSVDLGLFTVKLQAGADLFIWGPEFGGKADVDLDVVSFTINFGAAPAALKPVGWSSFQQSFLPPDTPAPSQSPVPSPAPIALAAMPGRSLRLAADPAPTPTTNIVKVTVSAGLVSTAVPGYDAIIAANGFSIDIATTIPANAARWQQPDDAEFDLQNDISAWSKAIPTPGQPFLTLPTGLETYSGTQVWYPTLDVAPMKKEDVTSELSIAVLKHDGDGFADPITDIRIAPVLLPSNTAMWKVQDVSSDPNLPALLPQSLVGLTLAPVPRRPDKVSAVPMIDLLFTHGNDTGFKYAKQAVVPGWTIALEPPDRGGANLKITLSGNGSHSLDNDAYHLQSLVDSWVAAQRAAVAADLVAAGFGTLPPDAINLATLANEKALTDWPMIRQLGA